MCVTVACFVCFDLWTVVWCFCCHCLFGLWCGSTVLWLYCLANCIAELYRFSVARGKGSVCVVETCGVKEKKVTTIMLSLFLLLRLCFSFVQHQLLVLVKNSSSQFKHWNLTVWNKTKQNKTKHCSVMLECVRRTLVRVQTEEARLCVVDIMLPGWPALRLILVWLSCHIYMHACWSQLARQWGDRKRSLVVSFIIMVMIMMMMTKKDQFALV